MRLINTKHDIELLQVLVASCCGVEKGKLRVDAVDRLANHINLLAAQVSHLGTDKQVHNGYVNECAICAPSFYQRSTAPTTDAELLAWQTAINGASHQGEFVDPRIADAILIRLKATIRWLNDMIEESSQDTADADHKRIDLEHKVEDLQDRLNRKFGEYTLLVDSHTVTTAALVAANTEKEQTGKRIERVVSIAIEKNYVDVLAALSGVDTPEVFKCGWCGGLDFKHAPDCTQPVIKGTCMPDDWLRFPPPRPHSEMEEQRACIIALSDAKPQSVFEQMAEKIKVEVTHHNGGIQQFVTLWEVLKYPDAFEITTLRIINDPRIAPRWRDGKFILMDKDAPDVFQRGWCGVAFNINNNVRVKLTPYGRALHGKDHEDFWDQHDPIRHYPHPYAAPKEDADGWSVWQLWTLMQAFGPHIHIGMHEQPFETTIMLELT